MSQGYIRLHRKIQDCWVWDDKFSRGQAWVDLILLANHKEKKFPFDNEIITIERGQYLTSMRKLSERWKWHRNTVKGFLQLLEKDQMIKLKVATSYTLITIINYDIYQYNESDSVPPTVPPIVPEDIPPTVPEGSQKLAQTINDINDINDINENNIIPPYIPPEGEKKKPKKSVAKEMRNTFVNMVNETELSDAMKNIITEWIDYKIDIKDGYKTERGFKNFLSQITKYTLANSDDEIIDVVNRTMAAEYKGIVWSWLEKKNDKTKGSTYVDAIQNRLSVVDKWLKEGE